LKSSNASLKRERQITNMKGKIAVTGDSGDISFIDYKIVINKK
jgi:hypothetical protein